MLNLFRPFYPKLGVRAKHLDDRDVSNKSTDPRITFTNCLVEYQRVTLGISGVKGRNSVRCCQAEKERMSVFTALAKTFKYPLLIPLLLFSFPLFAGLDYSALST